MVPKALMGAKFREAAARLQVDLHVTIGLDRMLEIEREAVERD